MGFADEVLAHSRQQGPRCTICEWLAGLTVKERAEYEPVLSDRSFQATAISRALKSRNISFGVDTVRRHRNGECKQAKR